MNKFSTKSFIKALKVTALALIFGVGFIAEAQAQVTVDKTILFNNASNDSVLFWWQQNVDQSSQIYQSIKPYGTNTWGTPVLISDPNVNATDTLQVIQDSSGNFLVAWLGINLTYGELCIYANVYVAETASWIGPSLISDTSQLLVGTFIIQSNPAISNQEVIWLVYDSAFNTEIFSRQISIGGTWGPINQVNLTEA